jgi:hypothetical protein
MNAITNALVENKSCCPECDFNTRIVGFIITFLIGIILSIMSFGALGGLFIGKATGFAILYSLGNITSLCS